MRRWGILRRHLARQPRLIRGYAFVRRPLQREYVYRHHLIRRHHRLNGRHHRLNAWHHCFIRRHHRRIGWHHYIIQRYHGFIHHAVEYDERAIRELRLRRRHPKCADGLG